MQYRKKIEIMQDDRIKIDRSLDSTRFQAETNYLAPNWHEMIEIMHANHMSTKEKSKHV